MTPADLAVFFGCMVVASSYMFVAGDMHGRDSIYVEATDRNFGTWVLDKSVWGRTFKWRRLPSK